MKYFEKKKIEKTIPKELRFYMNQYKKALKKDDYADNEFMQLECEMKDMLQCGLITKEQAEYVKRKYLYGEHYDSV